MATIRKRGKNYTVRIYAGMDGSGKKIFRYHTFKSDPGKTQKENYKAARLAAAEYEKIPAAASGSTFADFAEKYINAYMIPNLSPKTVQVNTALINIHLLPALGRFRLDKITPLQITDLLNGLTVSRKDGRPGGYSAKTINHIRVLLSAIFEKAMAWNLIIKNPCKRITTPGNAVRKSNIKYFTLEETRAFLAYLDARRENLPENSTNTSGKIPLQYVLFFKLAIFCGCRRGELIALKWNDIENNVLHINKSSIAIHGERITKAPKTAAGFRDIVIPDNVLPLISEWREKWEYYRSFLASEWRGSDYVFIQADGSQIHPDTLYKVFKKILARYNAENPDNPLPDIPLHGLRHTNATLTIASGADLSTVSGRLGHSRTSTTLDIYTHTFQEKDRTAAAALNAMLS